MKLNATILIELVIIRIRLSISNKAHLLLQILRLLLIRIEHLVRNATIRVHGCNLREMSLALAKEDGVYLYELGYDWV